MMKEEDIDKRIRKEKRNLTSRAKKSGQNEQINLGADILK